MKLRTNSPNWFNEDHSDQEAKCVSFPGSRGYDPWFGTGDKDNIDEHDTTEMDEAKQICLGAADGRPCPLLKECREFALVNNERFGIWGGTDPEERKIIRKKRREASKWQQNQDGDRSSLVA